MSKFLDQNGVQILWDAIKDKIVEGDENLMTTIAGIHSSITATRTPAGDITKGTNTTITINPSATFDGKPLSFTTTVDGSPITANRQYTINTTKTFSVVINVNNESDPKFLTTKTVNLTVNAYYPKYYYVGNDIENAPISSFVASGRSDGAAATISKVTNSSNAKIWFCVAEPCKLTSVELDGSFGNQLELDSSLTPISVPLTINGIQYNCYCTPELAPNTRTFKIQAYNKPTYAN